MNRIEIQRQTQVRAPHVRAAMPAASVAAARCVALAGEAPCALFSPVHYEPNYSYPLIVWLHGPRDDERQLARIMPLVSMRNYLAVGPRGTQALGESGAKRGFAWSQDSDQIEVAEQQVLPSIRSARGRFYVAASRVYLAGFQCGGTMALRIGVANPERFAGVLSFGGAWPVGGAPLSRLREARKLPLVLATMRDSTRYPASRVCDDLRLLHSAGMSVNLRQYPCGDDLTTPMLADMDRWIMQQITGQ